MQSLKTKIRRFYFRLKHDYFSFDNIVFFVAIFACIFWTYSSLTATARNWELSQKLTERKRELARLSLEVETLELENQYYASDEFKELSARLKQNKELDGEHLVYLSENSPEALARDQKASASETEGEVPETPSNVSQWMSFLFGV